MTTTTRSTLPVASTPVPMLDIGRQNEPLRAEIDAAVLRVCDSGAFIHGPDCRNLESMLAEYCGTPHAVGCASGSDALVLSLMALGIGKGDEVLLPSFTFFATAGAVWRVGATPVFVDIEPNMFNLCPRDTEAKITNKTRAILAVHLFGQCADMMALGELARRHDLEIIEDAAQSIGAEHLGRRTGSLGTLGCFSFYPSKNLGAFGDGGMITTHSEELAARLRILRDHGQHPTYHHQLVGVNSRLDTIQAAVLSVKLPKLDLWSAGRGLNASRYTESFSDAQFASQITAPPVAPGFRSIWNQYTIRVHNGRRDELRAYLSKRQIGTAVYYPVPLHLQQCFESLNYEVGSLPHTERAAEEVLSLPIFPELTEFEQQTVITAVSDFVAAGSDASVRDTAAKLPAAAVA